MVIPHTPHFWSAWVVVCTHYYFFCIDLFSLVKFVCRKSILYILMGIRLPSLPVSILYSCFSDFLITFIFNFVKITKLMLWKLKIFYLTMSQPFVATFVSSVSWHVLWTTMHFSLLPSLDTFLLRLLHTHSEWFALPHTGLVIGWTSLWLMYVTMISTVALCHLSTSFCAVCVIVLLVIFLQLFTFIMFNIAFWDLWTSTLLAQYNTCSLVIS